MVNETAPRTHNSGHATIESLSLSQFELHLRVLLDLALPTIRINAPAIMVNVIGSGEAGMAQITGLEELSAIPIFICIGMEKLYQNPEEKWVMLRSLILHKCKSARRKRAQYITRNRRMQTFT